MAVPRLAAPEPFIALDPAVLEVTPRQAASIGGSARHGRPVGMEEMEPVDLVVTGCVAVSTDGARLGKGGGFSDLEFALAWEAGLIGRSTVVCTTVADVQVLDDGRIPVTGHDMSVDLIATPTRVLRCTRPARRGRLVWSELTEEKVASIPLLVELQRRRRVADGGH